MKTCEITLTVEQLDFLRQLLSSQINIPISVARVAGEVQTIVANAKTAE